MRPSHFRPAGLGPIILSAVPCSADRSNCVLLPDPNRKFPIPRAGGLGRSNVRYPLESDGSEKEAPWIQDVLGFIDDYEGGNILQNPELAEEDSAAVIEKALAQSKGQGFARTPDERRTLENYVMAAAKEYFTQNGFDVEDVSVKRSYDLLCVRDPIQLHIEVKGTTTNGDAIVLTKNEVKHACDPRHVCVLFVLHSIVLSGGNPSGGKHLILNPCHLEHQCLTAVSYTYRLR